MSEPGCSIGGSSHEWTVHHDRAVILLQMALYEYDTSGMLGWEMALFDKVMSFGSSTRKYSTDDFIYG